MDLNPQELWAEPPHDERWEIPGAAAADHGGDLLGGAPWLTGTHP